MTFDEVDRMVRGANPVPDLSLLASDVGVLDEGSRTMTTKSPIETGKAASGEPERRRWSGPLMAAAVVAVIATVGVIALQATRGGPEARPPVATTVAADPLMTVPDEFLGALSAGDTNAVTAIVTEDARIDVGPAAAWEDLGPLLDFFDANGFTFEFTECGPEGTPATETTSYLVDCDPVVFANAWSIANGSGPFETSIRLRIQGDRVTSVEMPLGIPEYSDNAWIPFRDWVEINRPQDIAVMYEEDSPFASLTDESIELWRRNTVEYVAAQSS